MSGLRPPRTSTLVVVALALIAGCSVNPPPEDASGEEIYAILCSNCHGDDLAGGTVGPPLGEGSNSVDRPDSFLETTIEHGRGRMPSFSSTLNEEQVARLIGYIRQVQDQ